MTLLNYDEPIPETASVTCDDCFWTASGPWSHKAGREHGAAVPRLRGGLMDHLTTDPACRWHETPRNWWQRLRFNRNRGRSCLRCETWTSRRDYLMTRGLGRGEASALATIEEN